MKKSTPNELTSKPKKVNHKLRILYGILAFLVFCGALAMIFHTPLLNAINTYTNDRRTKQVSVNYLKNASADDLDKLKANIKHKLAEDKAKSPAPNYDVNNPAVNMSLSDRDIMNTALNAPHLEQVSEIAIPSIQLNVPIYEGLSSYTISAGAGEQEPHSRAVNGGKGNYILASHNMSDSYHLFSRLGYTNVGDMIYTTDGNNVYEYRTVYVKRLPPSNFSPLVDFDAEKHNITLYTCGELSAVTRWVVRGELVKTVKRKDVTPDLVGVFISPKNTLSAWLINYYASVLPLG